MKILLKSGSSEERSKGIRSFVNGELLLDQNGYLPKNKGHKHRVDNPISNPQDELSVAGDARANEQPGMYTFFYNKTCLQETMPSKAENPHNLRNKKRQILFAF